MVIINYELLIEKIVNLHKKVDWVESFCLVGSFAKYKKGKDLDCLILTKKKLSDDYPETILSQLEGFRILKKIDDSFRILKNNFEIGLVYQFADDLYADVSELIRGKKNSIEGKCWAIGGKIPEVLLSDIVSASIMFDKKGRFTSLKDRLSGSYPKCLKIRLKEELEREIKIKLCIIEEALQKCNLLRFDLGTGELMIAFVRLIFAINEIYLPPLKHLDQEILTIPVKDRFYIKDLLNLPSLNRKEKVIEFKKLIQKIEYG